MYPYQTNTTMNAYSIDTGKLIWSFFIPDVGLRGGTIVSGGVVWFTAGDGFMRGLDADSGELLFSKNLGQPSSVQPSIGADADGKMLVLYVMGSRSGKNTPGAILAYGLPDVLPQPEIIEGAGEVQIEVRVLVINLIPYVAAGLGLGLVVIAGILVSRRGVK